MKQIYLSILLLTPSLLLCDNQMPELEGDLHLQKDENSKIIELKKIIFEEESTKLEEEKKQLQTKVVDLKKINKNLEEEVVDLKKLKNEHVELERKFKELSKVLENISQENELLAQEVSDLDYKLKNTNDWDVVKLVKDFEKGNYIRSVTKGYMLAASSLLPVFMYLKFRTK